MIETPFLTVDGIVEMYTEEGVFQGIVLIERANNPVGLALPGGFVDIGETVENALIREMKEEISLDVTIESLLGVYSDPLRDKRFHTVSVVFICKATGIPVGADDAKEASVFPIDAIAYDQLVFDHAQILKEYSKARF